MAEHFKVTIKLAYDDAFDIPSVLELEDQVTKAMGEGLFNYGGDGDSVVEGWSSSVEDTTASTDQGPRGRTPDEQLRSGPRS